MEKSPPLEEWEAECDRRIRLIMDGAPSGSGIDSGTKLAGFSMTHLRRSTDVERMTFRADYHHMNQGGFYDGWTNHSIIVRASLNAGFDLRITGSNRNQIKDYLGDVYHYWLDEEIGEEFK